MRITCYGSGCLLTSPSIAESTDLQSFAWFQYYLLSHLFHTLRALGSDHGTVKFHTNPQAFYPLIWEYCVTCRMFPHAHWASMNLATVMQHQHLLCTMSTLTTICIYQGSIVYASNSAGGIFGLSIRCGGFGSGRHYDPDTALPLRGVYMSNVTARHSMTDFYYC